MGQGLAPTPRLQPTYTSMHMTTVRVWSGAELRGHGPQSSPPHITHGKGFGREVKRCFDGELSHGPLDPYMTTDMKLQGLG